MRYIDIDPATGQTVGQPFGQPATMPVRDATGAIAWVGSAHWAPAAFAPYGKVPVDGAANPAIEVETGYAYDAAAGVARPVIAARPLDVVRAEACTRIDTEAEVRRLAYVTPGAAQSMVYQAKEAEARALADVVATAGAIDPVVYPHLAAEVGITADTIEGVGQVVLLTASHWRHVSAAIEGARLAAKQAVAQAATPAEVLSIANVAWPA